MKSFQPPAATLFYVQILALDFRTTRHRRQRYGPAGVGPSRRQQRDQNLYRVRSCRNRACLTLPWIVAFLDFGFVQGHIVPELIMAENKDPFCLTDFFKKWREKEEDFLVVFGANKFCTGKVVVEGGRWKERKKNPRVSSKLVVVVCLFVF